MIKLFSMLSLILAFSAGLQLGYADDYNAGTNNTGAGQDSDNQHDEQDNSARNAASANNRKPH